MGPGEPALCVRLWLRSCLYGGIDPVAIVGCRQWREGFVPKSYLRSNACFGLEMIEKHIEREIGHCEAGCLPRADSGHCVTVVCGHAQIGDWPAGGATYGAAVADTGDGEHGDPLAALGCALTVRLPVSWAPGLS